MANQQHENTSSGHYLRQADGVKGQHSILSHRNGKVIVTLLLN